MSEVDELPALRFQDRDGEILKAVYKYDGVLAKRHLKEMFWPNKSLRAMEKRLSLLFHNGYLNWPTREQWRHKPIPEAIVWLGYKGALWIAGGSEIEIETTRNEGESQMRLLESKFRKRHMRWLREPGWSQLAHDLAVVDVRRAVENAAAETQSLTLEEWIPESAFRLQMDVVEYKMRSSDDQMKHRKKGIRPDGYFVIADEHRRSQGLQARARFLLEMDMATHDTGSFIHEKVVAGLAYIKSPEYKTRFGANAGCWLVVATSERRMKHLMHQSQQAVGAGASYFLFTLIDQVKKENALISPIWFEAGREQPRALLPG